MAVRTAGRTLDEGRAVTDTERIVARVLLGLPLYERVRASDVLSIEAFSEHDGNVITADAHFQVRNTLIRRIRMLPNGGRVFDDFRNGNRVEQTVIGPNTQPHPFKPELN
jgi:hypothetical protein